VAVTAKPLSITVYLCVTGMQAMMYLPVTVSVCQKDRCHLYRQGIMRRSVPHRVWTRPWPAPRWTRTWVNWCPRASTRLTPDVLWSSRGIPSSWREESWRSSSRRCLLPHLAETTTALTTPLGWVPNNYRRFCMCSNEWLMWKLRRQGPCA